MLNFVLSLLFVVVVISLFGLAIAFFVGFSDKLELRICDRCYNLGEKLAEKINKRR